MDGKSWWCYCHHYYRHVEGMALYEVSFKSLLWSYILFVHFYPCECSCEPYEHTKYQKASSNSKSNHIVPFFLILTISLLKL